jgi:signal transduction histidine kinase
MTSEKEPRFFGRVVASLSHELKNALAVLNENAGLAGDLIEMAEELGRPLNTERLTAVVKRLKANVKTTDEIAGSLNRFGHVVDVLEGPVDLDEVVLLALRLYRRHADRLGAKLEPSLEPVSLRGPGTRLEWLMAMFAVLDGLLGRPEKYRRVDVALDPRTPAIWFQPSDAVGSADVAGAARSVESLLAEDLPAWGPKVVSTGLAVGLTWSIPDHPKQ